MRPGRKRKISYEDELLIVELYDPNKGKPLTLEQLAEKFEVSVETIRRYLKKHKKPAVHGPRENM